MDITTSDNLTEQKEAFTREVLETLVHPMVDQAGAAWLAKLETEQVKTRTDITSAMKDFVTVDEFDRLSKQYTDFLNRAEQKLDTNLEDRNKEDERRWLTLEQRINSISEVADSSNKRSLENETHIAAIKADTDARIKNLEARMSKLEDVQKAQSENITTMTRNTEAIRNSVQTLSNTVIEQIDRDKRRQEEIDREINAVKDTLDDHAARTRVIDNDLRRESGIIRDIEGRVSLTMTSVQTALYGDEKEKRSGLVADMATLNSGLWWQAWMGRHPYLTLQMIGAAYVIGLIVLAFIIGRPEIIAAMIPAPIQSKP